MTMWADDGKIFNAMVETHSDVSSDGICRHQPSGIQSECFAHKSTSYLSNVCGIRNNATGDKMKYYSRLKMIMIKCRCEQGRCFINFYKAPRRSAIQGWSWFKND